MMSGKTEVHVGVQMGPKQAEVRTGFLPEIGPDKLYPAEWTLIV